MTDTKIPQDVIDDLPQPYAQAITLLEGFADHGCLPFYEDGSPTPNRALCLEAAGNLRALLRDQRQAVPDGMLTEVQELCRIICNSPKGTVIDGEIESRAFALGHFPQVISAAPTMPESQCGELLAALKEAKRVIKSWHGDEVWEIYDQHSTEMKRINGAIAKWEAMLSAAPTPPSSNAEGVDLTPDVEQVPNTLGGFKAVFYAFNKRTPTDQDIWNAAVKSAKQRYATPPSSNAERVPVGSEPEAWKRLQQLKNPHSGKCQVSAHAWDTAIIEAMRIVLNTPPEADAKPDGEAVAWCKEYGDGTIEYQESLQAFDIDDEESREGVKASYPLYAKPTNGEFVGEVAIDGFDRRGVHWRVKDIAHGTKLFTHPSNDAMRKALEKRIGKLRAGLRSIHALNDNEIRQACKELIEADDQALANGEGK